MQVTWEHAKFGLDATGHLSWDFLERRPEHISEAWRHQDNSKRCISAMIRLWVENPDYSTGYTRLMKLKSAITSWQITFARIRSRDQACVTTLTVLTLWEVV